MRKTTRYQTVADSPSRAPKRASDRVDRAVTIKTLDFLIPVQTVSEANQREHYMVKHRRKKAQQVEAMVALHNNLSTRKIAFPCVVKLTRIGAKALDTDNLAGSFKHVQDAIARKLGVDDGDADNVKWEYCQMPIGVRQYGIKVEIKSV